MNGPTGAGNGALDVNGTFLVSGGTLLAAGSSGMAVAPEPAGTVVRIVSADGTEVVSFSASESFSSVVKSSAQMTSGATYTVSPGDIVVGTFTAGDAPTGGMGMGGGMGGRPGG